MRNPLYFFVDLFRQPAWVPLWVMGMMALNLASLFFWPEPVAQSIFFTFLASAALMMGLYAIFGYEKILGLGHVLWIPLMAYILPQIQSFDGAFLTYLVVFSAVTLTSLAIDIFDVWSYFAARGRARKT